jgi:lipoprotein-anchoring transpeptidase ErfK/SrfK
VIWELGPGSWGGIVHAIFLFLAAIAAALPQTPAQPAPKAASASPGLDLQTRLDRAGFSPGEIDGRPGMLTRKAVAAFQESRKLPGTGRADAATLAALAEAAPGDTVVAYQVTAEDVAGPFTEDIPEDMMERAKLPALNYTSALEELSERFHASPALLRALNPGAQFTSAGEALRVPHVRALPEPPAKGTAPAKGAAPAPVTVTVSKSERALTVADESGRVLLYAPVTVGSTNDPLPIGDWKVTGVQRNPVFHYNPDLFWDADPSHAKAKIPAGPNNPVGVVWVDLSRPHYGLHGAPEPANIGRTESHGCVRLTNWDALHVAALVAPGTPVLFRP